MTDKRTLADFVELALKRRDTNSGRRLAEIAAADGHDISHSTINRIRKGNYTSEPTTAILRAIAHLAKEPEELVFAAAAVTSEWGELEVVFDAWDQASERVAALTARYARLRGISMHTANEELNDMHRQMTDFRAGRSGWYPPWDPTAAAQRASDGARPPLRIVDDREAARTPKGGGPSEGELRKRAQDDAAQGSQDE